MDTVAPFQGSDGGFIPVSEVHELLTTVFDILDNAVSLKLYNTAHNLAYHFNSSSRQCLEIWGLQFPFFKDTVPPSEALWSH